MPDQINDIDNSMFNTIILISRVKYMIRTDLDFKLN